MGKADCPLKMLSKLQAVEKTAIIESHGAALMEVVCRDACDGHRLKGTVTPAQYYLDRYLTLY